MEVTHATPDAEPEPTQESTPAPAGQEPAAPPAVEPAADQSAAVADARLAQAEYTRSQQAFAELKAELGLDKRASRDEVIAAVAALKSQPAPEPSGDEQPEEIDPRVAEAEQRAFAAELRYQQAIYEPIFGRGYSDRALELVNTMRTTNDPSVLFESLAAFIEGVRPTAAAGPEPAAAAADATSTPGDVGLPEGDQAASARPTAPSATGRRESGVTTAIRGIFREAGIASR